MPFPHRVSQRIHDLHPSPIREILALADRPDMISFAGGLPAPESFPHLPLEFPQSILQYGATEGDRPLRERIASEMRALGVQCAAEQVLILSGSQQGIDLVAKLFIDPGAPVAVETPTYLAALQVFRFFGARFLPFHADAAAPFSEAQALPAFAYVIPTFQNPTGRCYTRAQRSAFAASADAVGIPVFEDDPYRDLAYDPCDRTPICAHLKKAAWIYQGSFSKTLAPGLRLGFMVASPDLVTPLTRLKQAADLHSNRLSQWLVLRELEHPQRAERMTGLVVYYRRKRDAFAAALREHFADLADWETPKGGLFFWLKLKAPCDTQALLQQAIAQNIAFMPGAPFFATQSETSCLRLNFSLVDEALARQGLARLAALLRQAL